MKFCDKLNEYINLLSCTAKELCALSGISAATFSRYRRGERIPELGTAAFESLCAAIAKTAAQKDICDITPESVKNEFLLCEDFNTTDKEILRRNFNSLVVALDINLNRLSKHTSYAFSASAAAQDVPQTRSSLRPLSLLL